MLQIQEKVGIVRRVYTFLISVHTLATYLEIYCSDHKPVQWNRGSISNSSLNRGYSIISGHLHTDTYMDATFDWTNFIFEHCHCLLLFPRQSWRERARCLLWYCNWIYTTFYIIKCNNDTLNMNWGRKWAKSEKQSQRKATAGPQAN